MPELIWVHIEACGVTDPREDWTCSGISRKGESWFQWDVFPATEEITLSTKRATLSINGDDAED